MCESRVSRGIGRREFLVVSEILGTARVLSPGAAGEHSAAPQALTPNRDKQPAKILAAFAAALTVMLLSGGVLAAEPNAHARSFPPLEWLFAQIKPSNKP